MRELLDTADFLSAVRRRLRFGEFSRLPLRVLRVQVMADCAECDWLMRSADPWDSSLPRHMREEHETLQALRDALKMRELLFLAFPSVERAEVKVFRECAGRDPELLMTGTVLRENEAPARVASVVMRAKLCGFRFTLEDGVLETMRSGALYLSCL